LQNRQYYLDPYLKEYRTRVISSRELNGKYHVVLENTIFYPEGGGQPADRGLINQIPVEDVYEQDSQVVHVLAEPLHNTEVVCLLDWDRRFYHMQHHTGQHVISAVFYRLHQLQTCGFHLADEYSTVDIAAPDLSEDFLNNVELEINQLIQQDVAIKSFFTSKDQLSQLQLRKIPQVDSNIRIVEIDSFDAVPCCGTHLSSTGQVGLIKIMKVEKHRDFVRLYYRCGNRAFADYQGKHAIVTYLANLFSSADYDVLNRVNAALDDKRQLEQKYKNLKRTLLQFQALDLVRDTSGKTIVHRLCDDEDATNVQFLINTILALGHYFIVICVSNRVFLAHNLDTELDCGKLAIEASNRFGGRGGGKKEFAQVFFPTQEQLEQFINFLTSLEL